MEHRTGPQTRQQTNPSITLKRQLPVSPILPYLGVICGGVRVCPVSRNLIEFCEGLRGYKGTRHHGYREGRVLTLRSIPILGSDLSDLLVNHLIASEEVLTIEIVSLEGFYLLLCGKDNGASNTVPVQEALVLDAAVRHQIGACLLWERASLVRGE
jgi:hypothetical protein